VIGYILFPLIVIALVFVAISSSRGKDYKLVISLPPADTTYGKLVRIIVGILGLVLIVISLALFNIGHENLSKNSKIIGSVIFILTLLAIIYFSRHRQE
jgi:hypothetical protein